MNAPNPFEGFHRPDSPVNSDGLEVLAMPRFVYVYFNRDAPDRVTPVVPAHVQYWHSANLDKYQGGPFTDRSGGLITFGAPSLQAASAIVAQDPFVQADLIEQRWLKEWQSDATPNAEAIMPALL
jgi:uncharacterized protein YciI